MGFRVAFSLVVVFAAVAGLAHANTYPLIASPASTDLKWFSLSYFPQSMTIQAGDLVRRLFCFHGRLMRGSVTGGVARARRVRLVCRCAPS